MRVFIAGVSRKSTSLNGIIQRGVIHEKFFHAVVPAQPLGTSDHRLPYAACSRLRLCLERLSQASGHGVSCFPAAGQPHL